MNRQSCNSTIERWKLDLVRARAYRFGFRGADLDDAQQDVLLEVIAFKFQLERSNGANEATALVSLIDRRLCMVKRRQRRYQQHFDRFQQSSDPKESAAETGLRNHEDRISRHLDLQKVIASLASKDRLLCDALAAGASIDSIASRLHCSWHTVKRRIDNLRKAFAEKEIDGYVE